MEFFTPKITPAKNFVFKNNLDNDNFNIVISCEEKCYPSIYLKNKFKNKIINIHVKIPKVSLKNFDFVVVPEHDSLNGANVISTKGAIHYLTKDELVLSQNYLKSKINPKKKIVSFVIGGPNKYYNYNDKTIDGIFLKIKKKFYSK